LPEMEISTCRRAIERSALAKLVVDKPVLL
jgi:hypothetical protein